MDEKQIRSMSEKINEYCITYLKKMVSIYSTSCNEKTISDYIKSELSCMGVIAKQTEIGEKGANIEAEICGIMPGPIIGLAGHLDTISIVDGWETDPLVLTKKNGKLYGLGVCDMKAGNAIILALTRVIIESGISFCGKIKIYFVSDEEGYSKGAKQLLKEKIEPDIIYMPEANYERAIIGAVGKVLISVTVKGTACHAAWPEKGINAVEEASELIAALKRLSLPGHPYLRPQPFVPLSIKGGYDDYSLTVPEICTFTLNKHLVPGENKKEIINNLRELIKMLELNADITFEIKEPYYVPYGLAEDSDAVTYLKQAYKIVTGKDLLTEYGEGVSDANCFYALGGVDTVNFGPMGGNMHCANEWLDPESVLVAIKVYLTLLASQMSFKEGV